MENNLSTDYFVTLASAEDTLDILQLLRNVAGWLKKQGRNQWESVGSGEDDDEIIEAISKKEAYVVRRNNEITAVFMLYEKQTHWDEWLWGKMDDSSVYLHKFAIAPEQIGNGLGKAILHWIEESLRRKNIKKLKLDCIATNEKLNLFYETCKFHKVRVSKQFSLFEKKLV